MNDNLEPNVGRRIRVLRGREGLSLRALSDQCGLSINAISQIERGENSPTVASLHRLATALNVSITDLFHDEERQVAVFVKQGLGLKTQNTGVQLESLGFGLPSPRLEPFRITIEPGAGNSEDPITHAGEEFVYCLKGEVDYHVGDLVFQLRAGDSLLFEATQPHICLNLTQNQAEILLVFQASQGHHSARRLHMEA